MDKMQALKQVSELICNNECIAAETLLQEMLPFEAPLNAGRSYYVATKLSVFFRDGFIDRYSGEKLLNPGYLRALSKLFQHRCPFINTGKWISAIWLFGNIPLRLII